MEEVEKLLRTVGPKSLLDVAAGAGNSMGAALETWPDCSEFIGIDITDKGFEQAVERFAADGRMSFREMSATAMDFPDSRFDVVMMLNSLHHMEDPCRCLTEMYRVLSPGGLLWLAEMYRDGQRPTQMTHVLFHHWWSKVDRMTGICHNETFTRQELLDMAAELSPAGMDIVDNHGNDDSVDDPEIIEHFEKAFETYREKYSELPGKEELDREGKELLQRVRDVGFAHATQLNLVIRK